MRIMEKDDGITKSRVRSVPTTRITTRAKTSIRFIRVFDLLGSSGLLKTTSSRLDAEGKGFLVINIFFEIGFEFCQNMRIRKISAVK